MYAEWWKNRAIFEIQQEEQAKHPDAFVFMNTLLNCYIFGEKAIEASALSKKYGTQRGHAYSVEIDSNGGKVDVFCRDEVALNKLIKRAAADGIEIIVIPYDSPRYREIEPRAQKIFTEEIRRRVAAYDD